MQYTYLSFPICKKFIFIVDDLIILLFIVIMVTGAFAEMSVQVCLSV